MSDPSNPTVVDPAVLDTHAQLLDASAQRLVDIGRDLLDVSWIIYPDAVNSGFGSFAAAVELYGRFAALHEQVVEALGATVHNVREAAAASGSIAENYRAVELANDVLLSIRIEDGGS